MQLKRIGDVTSKLPSPKFGRVWEETLCDVRKLLYHALLGLLIAMLSDYYTCRIFWYWCYGCVLKSSSCCKSLRVLESEDVMSGR